MTYTKKTFVIPVLAAMVTILAFSIQNAEATTFAISNNSTCQASSIGGVWNSANGTCTVGNLSIGSGDKLFIAKGTTLNVSNFTNSGTVINNQTIYLPFGGILTNMGTVTNNNVITNINGGTISNNGTFNNIGKIRSTGTIANWGGGTFTILSGAVINTKGVITSAGNIVINKGGILQDNNGTFTNTLNLVNNGTVNNSGTFTNNGTVTNNRQITNSGTIDNNNTITNNGQIFDLCGGTVNNTGTMTGRAVVDKCV